MMEIFLKEHLLMTKEQVLVFCTIQQKTKDFRDILKME